MSDVAMCGSVVMSNMWFGLMEFHKAGDKLEQHHHKFDHCTLLSYGEFQIVKYFEDGTVELDEMIKAPCLIHIEKGRNHSLVAKTDGAIACCCHAIYESEQSLFPIETDKVPVVGGSLKLSLIEAPDM